MKRRSFLATITALGLSPLAKLFPVSKAATDVVRMTPAGEMATAGHADGFVGTVWHFKKILTDEEIRWLINNGVGRAAQEVFDEYGDVVSTIGDYYPDGAFSLTGKFFQDASPGGSITKF